AHAALLAARRPHDAAAGSGRSHVALEGGRRCVAQAVGRCLGHGCQGRAALPRHPYSLYLARGSCWLQQRSVRLRPAAGARRRRAGEAQHGAAPRVHRRLRAALEAKSPVYPELEAVKLSFSLERMREYLGPDHPVIKSVLGSKTPDQRAQELIAGSRLADPGVRTKLFEGGQAAVKASTDPMIALARQIDSEARRLRKIYEEEVEGPERVAQQ